MHSIVIIRWLDGNKRIGARARGGEVKSPIQRYTEEFLREFDPARFELHSGTQKNDQHSSQCIALHCSLPGPNVYRDAFERLK